MKRRVAIIDLGSNSVRLVVVEIGDGGSYHQIEDIKESVRLAESLIDGKPLSAKVMHHAVETIKLFVSLCQALEVQRIIPIATAATRMASNQREFLDLLRQESGLDFRVLSGSEEAYYGYLGVANTVHVSNGVTIDVGGGSTQIVKFRDRKIVRDGNFPLGTILLTEQFQSHTAMSRSQLESMLAFLREKFAAYPWLKTAGDLPVVGMGGAIRSLARIDRRRKGYLPDRTHDYVMTRQDVKEILEHLAGMDAGERRSVPGLSAERTDIIVAGVGLVYAMMQEGEFDTLIASGTGLRFGLLFEYLFPKAGDPLVPSVLMYSIDNMMRYYGLQEDHARHVSNLALSLFDQLREVHGYGPTARRILLVSSLLHDTGVGINYNDHDEHTLYLITRSRLNGLTHREMIICAYVAAAHYRRFVWNGIDNYMAPKGPLQPQDIDMIKKLGIILRIANGLDRCSIKAVTFVNCIVKPDRVLVMAKIRRGAELEIRHAMSAAEEFEDLFNRKLEIEPINH
ncbi:MAG: Ppx/GppA family phosphatase [Firmicutes bacterium]|nr:Ppx/GppA family phosphatase [Bacillota bacterium]